MILSLLEVGKSYIVFPLLYLFYGLSYGRYSLIIDVIYGFPKCNKKHAISLLFRCDCSLFQSYLHKV
jgi:hypothetical protein